MKLLVLSVNAICSLSHILFCWSNGDMNYCCGRMMINLVHGASSGTKGERLKWLNLISLNGSFFDYVIPRWVTLWFAHGKEAGRVHVCDMEQSLSPETKISSKIHSIWPFMINLWEQYMRETWILHNFSNLLAMLKMKFWTMYIVQSFHHMDHLFTLR